MENIISGDIMVDLSTSILSSNWIETHK
jgi:hypothetical protein